jgi:3-hydroxybutyryl-CoA dehydrogenase
MEIREVAVIGLGTMGAGIAEVFARAGLGVVAIEVDSQALNQGLGIVDASLSKAVSRGKLDASEQAAIRARIRPAAAFSEAAGVDLAVEVVPERIEIKRQIFTELDRVTSPTAILATNTSSLSVTDIAAASKHPGRVVGMHFFNPAPVMRLVEVVSTVLTDDKVADTVTALAQRLGKTPVAVTDRAGFVANALLLPYLNHAVSLLETEYASPEDIDWAATAGIGLPMGPLALLDLIGLDTALSIMEILHHEFGLARYVPAPLLRRLVAAGWTGRKAGRGIYDYIARDHGATEHRANGQGGEASVAAKLGGTGHSAGNGVVSDAPDTVTLIGSGDAAETAIATALASVGINVTRNASHPSDLILIAAHAGRPVLPAALAAGRADQSVGLHLPRGLLAGGVAELIRTSRTSDEALEAGSALAAKLGLDVVCAPDRPGFLVGALLYPHLADAVRMVQDGYATALDIDNAMMLGCGYPQGPFELLDAAGAAAVLAGLEAMYSAYGYPSFAPPPLLAEHAAAGIEFRNIAHRHPGPATGSRPVASSRPIAGR